MEFDFDLETCQVELERVRDLLTIVIEFMDEVIDFGKPTRSKEISLVFRNQLPQKPDLDYETVLFARRAGTFGSVVIDFGKPTRSKEISLVFRNQFAAFSKTDAIIQSIDKSINDFYNKQRAENEKPLGKTKERTVKQ